MNGRKIKKVVLSICLTIFVVLFIVGAVFYVRMSSETRRGTVFASGYSYAAFNSVRNGMTKSEVLKLLGKPLKRGDYLETQNYSGEGYRKIEMWHYSDQRNEVQWWQEKVVVFDATTGRVCYKKQMWSDP